MERFVVTGLARAGSLADGESGLIVLETSAGPLELRLTYDDAERLIAGLQAARAKIQAERVRAAKPPLAETQKIATGFETAIDPVNQVAVIRARFADDTTEDARIPRTEIARLVEFLEDALTRFEGGAEMRQ